MMHYFTLLVVVQILLIIDGTNVLVLRRRIIFDLLFSFVTGFDSFSYYLTVLYYVQKDINKRLLVISIFFSSQIITAFCRARWAAKIRNT